MKVLIITSSPNKDGLTAACGEAARQGVIDGGGGAAVVCLNDLSVGRCSACNNAWGTCNKEHACQVEDDFQKLHAKFEEMDAYIFVTPVYWGEMSESAKAFFDRLRRCEASNKEQNRVQSKPVIAIAAAGGTGNGTLTCLSSMERLILHMRCVRYDVIGVTRKNKNYMLEAIHEAAEKMVIGGE